MNATSMATLPSTERPRLWQVASPFHQRAIANPVRVPQQHTGSFRPAVDLMETAEAFHLLVDLPGVHKDDLDITWSNGMLRIAAERKPEVEHRESLTYAERFYGSFARSFALPNGIDAENIEARFEDGVLSIAVPKGQQLLAKKVEVL